MDFSYAFRRIAFLSALLTVFSASAETIVLRAGTTVYGELDQRVISKKKEFSEGDFVRAHVWKHVQVDGQTVVRAGTPMMVRVSKLKTNKIFGVKGKLELEAVSVPSAEGNKILLDGGYDKSGKGRKGWTITGFLVLAWPLMFIQGGNAILETGTVFDCTVQADMEIEVEGTRPPRISLNTGPNVSATILYDEGEDENLPMELRVCKAELDDASIVSVNGIEIEPIPLKLGERAMDGDCETVQASVLLKKLGKHFTKGINHFEIMMAGKTVEVILEVEL